MTSNDNMHKTDCKRKEKNNVHAGHRNRMKSRYIESGLEGFAEHEILELLLMYAIPQKNVNPLAHELLDTFGSLSNVLRAERKLLAQVKGMGEASAALLKLVEDVMMYVEMKRLEEEPSRPSTISGAARFCLNRLSGLSNETLIVLSLNDAGKMLRCDEIAGDSGYEVKVAVQKICRIAIINQASHIIMAHNHPSGILTPSADDIETTKTINNALDIIGVNLADHLIVASGHVFSMLKNTVIAFNSESEIKTEKLKATS